MPAPDSEDFSPLSLIATLFLGVWYLSKWDQRRHQDPKFSSRLLNCSKTIIVVTSVECCEVTEDDRIG